MSLGLQAPHRMGSERSWALKGVDVGVGEPKTLRSPPTSPPPRPISGEQQMQETNGLLTS